MYKISDLSISKKGGPIFLFQNPTVLNLLLFLLDKFLRTSIHIHNSNKTLVYKLFFSYWEFNRPKLVYARIPASQSVYNNNFLPSNDHWRIFVDEIAAIILSTRFFLHHSSINQGPALSATRFDNAAERERQGSREFRFEIANRARAYSVCVCVRRDRAGSLSRLVRSGTILGRDKLWRTNKRQELDSCRRHTADKIVPRSCAT